MANVRTVAMGAGPASLPGMEQRISLITLGVTNLERARVFYERLGWRSQEVEESPFPDGRERAHPVGTRQAGRR